MLQSKVQLEDFVAAVNAALYYVVYTQKLLPLRIQFVDTILLEDFISDRLYDKLSQT